MDRKIILVDLDGVVFDWIGAVLNTMNCLRKGKATIERHHITNYALSEFFKGDEHLLKYATLTQGLYENLNPIEGSVEAVKQLRKDGHTVFFCTSPETRFDKQLCWTEKARSIDEHFGENWVDSLIITKDKTLVHGDVLVDDKPDITGVGPRSWHHLLYPTSYNADPSIKAWRGGWDSLFHYLKTGEKV